MTSSHWRAYLPESVRPYTEAGPVAGFLLTISSGAPYAMIGATLTTRLAQDGIVKSSITAFSLAFLVYNLKWLWAWAVDGVRLPIIGLNPSRNIFDVSANWLSMTTTASGPTIQPIVPPRAVNVPTLRRSDVNTGTVGGAGAAAGCCAKSLGEPIAPAAIASVDLTMNSRRFEFMTRSLVRLQPDTTSALLRLHCDDDLANKRARGLVLIRSRR